LVGCCCRFSGAGDRTVEAGEEGKTTGEDKTGTTQDGELLELMVRVGAGELGCSEASFGGWSLCGG